MNSEKAASLKYSIRGSSGQILVTLRCTSVPVLLNESRAPEDVHDSTSLIRDV